MIVQKKSSQEDLKITEELFDNNNNKIGEISFYPRKVSFTNKLYSIYKEILNSGKSFKKLEEIGIKNKEENRQLESLEDFENALKECEEIGNNIATLERSPILICEDLDNLLGYGTCDLYLEKSREIEDLVYLLPLIEIVISAITKISNEKVKPYLIDSESETLTSE